MIRKQLVRSSSKNQSLLSVSPHCCDWSDGAVLCDWSTAYSACRKRNAHCNNRMTVLETCQYIEKMVSIVPYQFEPESDDETVDKRLIRKHDWSRTSLSGKSEVLTSLW